MSLLYLRIIIVVVAIYLVVGRYQGIFAINDAFLALLTLVLFAVLLTFFFGINKFGMNKTESDVYARELRASYELNNVKNMNRAEYEAWWAAWCLKKHKKDPTLIEGIKLFSVVMLFLLLLGLFMDIFSNRLFFYIKNYDATGVFILYY